MHADDPSVQAYIHCVFSLISAFNEYVFSIYNFLYRHARMLRRFYEVSEKKIELYSTGWFQGYISQIALAPDAPVSLPLSSPYPFTLFPPRAHPSFIPLSL